MNRSLLSSSFFSLPLNNRPITLITQNNSFLHIPKLCKNEKNCQIKMFQTKMDNGNLEKCLMC